MDIYSEQVKYSHNSQHTEHDKSAQEEKRQYGQQVNDTVKGTQESQSCAHWTFLWIEQIGSPDTQDILDTENAHGNGLNGSKQRGIARKLVKCTEKDYGDVQQYDRHYEVIKQQAGQVVSVAYLDNVKNALLCAFSCLVTQFRSAPCKVFSRSRRSCRRCSLSQA